MEKQRRSALSHKRLKHLDTACIWHPFTQMQDYSRSEPLIIERGRGSCLYDIEGNTYIDGVSSLWVTVHGHRKRQIDEAIINQVGKICHSTMLGISNVPAIELAEKLITIAPEGLTKVFYSDSGSTAVEVALKIAYQYWQQISRATKKKKKFVSLVNAYHGDTIGAVSLGGIDLFHEIYRPLLFKTFKAASPYCYRCPYNKTQSSCGLHCLNSLEDILRARHAETAAFIMEPMVQGAAGMIVFPKGYCSGARELCTRYNVLCILDEVATGFGRTGRMFACEHENVRPDILAIAKGITGGTLPLAATLATDEVYSAFLGDVHECKTFYHGHTYTGNPVACAAACANIDIFRKEKVLSRLQPKIRQLWCRLEELKGFKHVGQVRQCGFMVGIELVADRKTKKPYSAKERIGHRVILEARRHGVIIRPLGDVIVLMPPLAIKEKEIDTLCSVVFDAIRTVTEE
jgi:adenosylmethionine---8-amino-7-oxononanoate aminotransferase